ncbi:protein of unknown function DUF1671 domain-containing protein [Theileria equi strain WA]|uniref:UFSP1/2/DUB catalytic domain-containing protein n=1 Tax=Theileria equi strain WA TaxID=1537102 RepID=L0B1A6_THEEQ|nr:protein of unknown function DUF1671 domain-containing protein [Theileria equi strain WA]AFZ81652.1 protein of unknown function DUF1671 domain-containing protein [Theileria equi strain WA]|eukprot:XP_004831318.1 protein of unknown function DUF1671 domain-containing protein [Theileria equi strain WA]
MSILLSLDIFKNVLLSSSESENSKKTILLYKFRDESTDSPWICSYRVNSSTISAGVDLDISVPCYLSFVGFLVLNHKSDPNVNSIGLKEKISETFYVLTLQKTCDMDSLNEALSVWKVQNNSISYTSEHIANSNIIWIEDDLLEVKRRNLCLVNVTYSLCTNLVNRISFDSNITGLKKIVDLPKEISDSILTTLITRISSYIHPQDNENALKIIVSECKSAVNSGGYDFCFDKNLKHVAILDSVNEKSDFYLKILLQSIVPVDLLLAYDMNSIECLRSIITSLQIHFSKLCTIFEKNPQNIYCYISKSKQDIVNSNLIEDKEIKPPATLQKKHSGPKGKIKKQSNSKQKQATSSSKNDQTTTAKKDEDKLESFDFIKKCNFSDTDVNIKFDTCGKIDLMPCLEEADIDEPFDLNVSFVFKSIVIGGSAKGYVKLPFGGYILPLFNLMSNNDLFVNNLFDTSNQSLKLKLFLNPSNFVDKRILISPHKHYHQFPPWMSSKTSRLYITDGDYQYYHYTQCNVNDVGWGCCYRSIQLVCSWYLLQGYTIKKVPNHQLIQKVLQENDISHKDIVIGSSKWIGTVESGYFINWYLNYNCKTLHVPRASDLRNFNGLMSDHFTKEGTPIIVGAGSYAYVILGLCMGPEPADFAYLISDPHYTGDDNIKSIQTKGGIGWKKVDFLSKAADGNFINLCCPQLDNYEV